MFHQLESGMVQGKGVQGDSELTVTCVKQTVWGVHTKLVGVMIQCFEGLCASVSNGLRLSEGKESL